MKGKLNIIVILVSSLVLAGCQLPFDIVWKNQSTQKAITQPTNPPSSTNTPDQPSIKDATAKKTMAATLVPGPTMSEKRMGHHQIMLDDGTILLIGGHGTEFTSLKTAEIFDPKTKKLTVKTMQYTHDMPGISKLVDGTYLIAGGSSNLGVPAYSTSELFDPKTQMFKPTGEMKLFRAGFGMTQLSGGEVLVASAWYTHNNAHTDAEIYDPKSGTFSQVGKLNSKRSYALVLPIDDGTGMVLGGIAPTGTPGYVDEVEIFDPKTKTFRVKQPNIFTNESGWTTTSNQYMRPMEEQLLSNGKYLLLAYKSENGIAKYQLVTIDKTSGVIEKLSIPLADSQTMSYFAPVVDRENNRAYLVAQRADATKIVVNRVDLATNEITTSDDMSLPANYYLSGLGMSMVDAKTIFMSGGNSETGYRTNFSPTDKTWLIQLE